MKDQLTNLNMSAWIELLKDYLKWNVFKLISVIWLRIVNIL